MSFVNLGLSEPLNRAIKKMGFEKPTEIQERALSVLLNSETDFIGLAQTGTGKTASFGLPLLQKVDTRESYTQGLILAPTRELCRQITEQLQSFGTYLNGLKILPIYGGTAIGPQLKELKKGQHIIVATPGRLIDVISRKALKLNQIHYLILDEADEMLNMGFKEEIDRILQYTPETKQTWLFSATMPNEIKRIVRTYMTDPEEVYVNSKDEVNTNISHYYAMVKSSDKADALCRFLDLSEDLRIVVFCRTKITSQNLAEYLAKLQYPADTIHGDLSQSQRDRVMKKFKDKSIRILVATDVAARGIDVDDISHVFHYSLPDDQSYYTHRSGRTARAGKKGKSIAFIHSKEKHRINQLERTLKINFEKILVPQAQDIIQNKLQQWLDQLVATDKVHYLDPKLLTQAQLLLSDISKEELVEKLLSIELKKLQLTNNKDLNDQRASEGSSNYKRNKRRGRKSFETRNNYKKKDRFKRNKRSKKKKR